MRTLFITAFLALAAITPAFAQNKLYQLRPHQLKPGQTTVISAISDSQDGKITITRGAVIQSGTMSVKRERSYQRTISGNGASMQLAYQVLIDQTSTSMEIGDKKDTDSSSGALVGHTTLGFLDKMNRWRLFLKGETATNRQAIEIAELEAYENRRWFTKEPVNVGSTWPIEPGFLRHLVERDLGRARVEASMTFQSVEMIDNESTAVLTFKVNTLGRKDAPTSGESSEAVATITGTLHLSLDSMLDKKLTMSGTLTTTARQGDQSTVAELPINYIVTKTVR